MLRALIPRTSARPVGISLPRTVWVKLNCLRTGVWRFHSSMHKRGLAPLPNHKCGTTKETADHVLTACPIHCTYVYHDSDCNVTKALLRKHYNSNF